MDRPKTERLRRHCQAVKTYKQVVNDTSTVLSIHTPVAYPQETKGRSPPPISGRGGRHAKVPRTSTDTGIDI